MNVKVLALSLAGVLALNATAQEVTSDYAQTTPAKEVSFKTGGKWFLNLHFGFNQMLSMDNQNWAVDVTPFQNNALPLQGGIGFGTWWNPYFATRFMVDLGQFTNDYANDKNAMFVNPHIDFMFDMSNYWAPYDADRVFHFIPYVGLGAFMGERVFMDDNLTKRFDWFEGERFNPIVSVSGHLGFDLAFNFSRNFQLTIGPSAAITNAIEFVSANGYEGNEFLTQLNLGLNFGLNNKTFEAIEPMDYELLNSLQSEINSLRSQNAELSKRPVRCPECPDQVVAPAAAPAPQGVVYFRIDSSKIDKNQFINIYQVAEFVKSTNTPITVTGYADVETGNPDYNMSLSEKRARNVADVLIEEYGVASDLITIDYKGDTVQPFETNAWNRVVIMKNK